MGETGWRDRAGCKNTDPEIFFPVAETGPAYAAQVAVAKVVCAGCPVRAECLREALLRIPYGIAGGLTPEERRGADRPDHDTAPAVAMLELGTRPGADRADAEAAGRVLLEAGRPVPEIALRCRVSERTVTRWAARAAHPDATAGRDVA